MPFWNPLISGNKVIELTYSDPQSGSPGSFNLYNYVNGVVAGLPGYSKVIVNIPNEYYFGAPSPTSYAFNVGNFASYQDVEINLDGYIVGHAGSGGSGGAAVPAGNFGNSGGNGQAGGRALTNPGTSNSVTLNISPTGLLAGGGGGQGGQASGGTVTPPTTEAPGSFSALAGSAGLGGAGWGKAPTGSFTSPATPAPRPDGPGPWSFRTSAPSGRLGQAGGSGPSNSNEYPTTSPGSGGAAGPYVVAPSTGISKLTINHPGSRVYGPNINPAGTNHPLGSRPGGPSTPT